MAVKIDCVSKTWGNKCWIYMCTVTVIFQLQLFMEITSQKYQTGDLVCQDHNWQKSGLFPAPISNFMTFQGLKTETWTSGLFTGTLPIVMGTPSIQRQMSANSIWARTYVTIRRELTGTQTFNNGKATNQLTYFHTQGRVRAPGL